MQLQILSRPHVTEIHFSSIEKTLPFLIKKMGRKAALVTDSTVHSLYKRLFDSLEVAVFSFPAGEASKVRATKEKLEDALFSHHFGKESCLIAVGGGTVMDIAGFTASTFCRGVPLILIPTTLLGMVDACLGGKTGVNTAQGKNLIGSFYFPTDLIIDETFLKTLPQKQLQNGMAEILKYGLIHSKELLTQIPQKGSLLPLIKRCLEIKKEIIELDPYEEQGRRRSLNFGHTIGHALERLENYQIDHGEAISIGMIVEGYLSQQMGFIKQSEFEELATLFRTFGFPLKLPRSYTLEEMNDHLARDKKASHKGSRFVLLKALGRVEPFGGDYCTYVEPSLLEKSVEWMNRHFACN